MKNKDLGSKKINNEQEVNEGFSGKNIADNYDPSKEKLNPETETDENGDSKTVKRARNNEQTDRNWNENESLSRDVQSEGQQQKTVENKDRNSDITSNRYPNSHPDNHKNRGNVELDEE